MQTITTYRESGRLFILRVMAIYRQLGAIAFSPRHFSPVPVTNRRQTTSLPPCPSGQMLVPDVQFTISVRVTEWLTLPDLPVIKML